MAFQKKNTPEVKQDTVRLILVDLAVEIPVELSFEGKKYELKPDGEVPRLLAEKQKDFSQYEIYDDQNENHVRLIEKKDELFVSRKNYGTFDMLREWDMLSPANKDLVTDFIKKLKNPVLPEIRTADEIK